MTFGTISGSISVREVNAAGCITNHTPLPVTVRPLPTAIISNSGTICAEDTHPVNIALTGTAPWSVVYAINGVDQPAINNILTSPYTLSAASAGNYTVTSVTDANGCTNTGIGNATVSYWPVPSAVISGTTAICGQKCSDYHKHDRGGAYTFTYTMVSCYGNQPPDNIYTFTVTPGSGHLYACFDGGQSCCTGTVAGSATVTINAQPYCLCRHQPVMQR